MSNLCVECGASIPTDVGVCRVCAVGFTLSYHTQVHETRIENYTIVSKLGEGGFGTVYLAEQLQPVQRQVALKLLRKEGLDDQAIQLFLAEQQALAIMDHPNIAKIFDAGETEQGEPYFVMEFLEGEPVTFYCDRRQLSLEERLKIFGAICRGVHHAHQKGVIHRDLKASNILVVESDQRAIPKIIDFGVAKAIGDTGAFRDLNAPIPTDDVIGSPLSMPPEQARGERDIDTRADIYALGVLLYELLAGSQPFTGAELNCPTIRGLLEMIESESPPLPSTRVSSLLAELPRVAKDRGLDPEVVQKRLRGDLDWIAMKALEKERQKRYDSVAALVGDIDSHLNHLPLASRHGSIVYRVGKMVRRNRELALTAAVLAAFALIALGVGVDSKRRLSNERAQKSFQSLLDVQMVRVPGVLSELKPFHGYVENALRREIHQARNANSEVRARLALLPNDQTQLKPIFEWMLLAPAEELSVALTLLDEHDLRAALEPMVWAVIEDDNALSKDRIRALAVAAAFFSDHPRWNDTQDIAASWLVSLGHAEASRWLPHFQPIAQKVLKSLREIYDRERESEEGRTASIALAEFLQHDDAALIELAEEAGPQQLRPIASVMGRSADRFVAELNRRLATPLSEITDLDILVTSAERQARLGLTLCLMGRESLVLPLLRAEAAPDLRSYLVHGMATYGVDWRLLRNQLGHQSDPAIVQGIITALGDYNTAQLPPPDREGLEKQFVKTYAGHPNAGVHSTVEWLLRKWKPDFDIRILDRSASLDRANADKSHWYYTLKQDYKMSILQGPLEFQMGAPDFERQKLWGRREKDDLLHEERLDRTIAIATKEPTVAKFMEFARALEVEDKRNEDKAPDGTPWKFGGTASPTPSLAMGSVSLKEAMLYCWWFSKQEGIPNDEQCYGFDGICFNDADPVTKEGYLLKTGYRLPTEAEWEYACRGGTKSMRYHGNSDDLLAHYAWFDRLGGDYLKEPGLLRPNAFGLFDMLGNAGEWCQDRYQHRYASHPIGQIISGPQSKGFEGGEKSVWRGGAYNHTIISIRAAARIMGRFDNRPSTSFRIVRTMPKT